MAINCMVFIFSVLLGVVIAEAYLPTDIDLKAEIKKIIEYHYFNVKCHFKADESCHVECTSADADDLYIHIQTAFRNERIACTSIKLHLKYGTFKNKIIEHKWLSNLTSQTVSILRLDHCSIQEIQENAFSGQPFQHLKSLIITDSKISNLTKHSFNDLKGLGKLVLWGPDDLLELHVEEKAFRALSGLTELELKNYLIKPESLINLTGSRGVRLPKLVTIDLFRNNIPELPNYAFINIPNLSTLNLKSNRIEFLRKNAFANCTSVRRLDLRQNRLTGLPEGVFNDLRSLLEGKLYIASNPWDCNTCSFKWLQVYYITMPYIDKSSSVYCEDGVSVEDAKPCLVNESEKNNSNYITTAIVEYGNNLSFTCQKLKNHEVPETNTNTKVYTQEIIIKDGSPINVTYHELQIDPLSLLITSKVNLSGYNLIRFSANDKTDIHCVTDLQTEIVVDRLARNTTYIFILLHKSQKFASPRSCFSITTDPEWEERPWLLNKHKTPTIIISVIIGCICGGFSVFITCYWFRRQNKKTDSQEKDTSTKHEKVPETIPITDEYEKNVYWEPSPTGYLTPNNNKYTHVYYGPLSDPQQRYSTASTCIELTAQKLYDIDLQLQKRKSVSQMSEPEVSGEYKPPLPPPNPSRKQSYRTEINNSAQQKTEV